MWWTWNGAKIWALGNDVDRGGGHKKVAGATIWAVGNDVDRGGGHGKN